MAENDLCILIIDDSPETNSVRELLRSEGVVPIEQPVDPHSGQPAPRLLIPKATLRSMAEIEAWLEGRRARGRTVSKNGSQNGHSS
jgi:hypothetical protein